MTVFCIYFHIILVGCVASLRQPLR